ncbi:polysaccharide biosynthesis/export family protein [Chachezhania antarctica]|uniref:polysaccharide biosynthesis/export family protein n=1 Tax=Chachezhania antarctica TaxID=2340860 RepID=UPI001968DFF0|nr:polysaccharide biosynthesis/export family protein [Chachezhania antarctica]|tara:strand:+ start:1761 stop:3131 length:1371 start_codon:yes stop_codon:yes gene_type:complete
MRIPKFLALAAVSTLFLSGCGLVYFSPKVNPVADSGAKVRVIPITSESVMIANRSTYEPKTLPAAFFSSAGLGSSRGSGITAPSPVVDSSDKPGFMATRLPPPAPRQPYEIGVGDIVLLATPSTGSTVEQLTGLLAASNSRQGYTVQDDGSIAIPKVGRVAIAGMTIEEAESELFRRLVDNQIDPTFSLEIAEFKSRNVSIGGAVDQPGVVPITLQPLYLDAALAAAGGVNSQDLDYASVRIYRDGELYQIPLRELYSNRGLQQIQLVDGDSVFVDTTYELNRAQAYFEERIDLARLQQSDRQLALTELRSEVDLRRNELNERRENFKELIQLDAIDRDYVYLTGEVKNQARYPMPYNQKATLADALYSDGGVPTRTGNVKQIYVLRGSPDPREFGAITAYQLDGTNATNFIYTTRFELRPNDIIFVAEQPVTKWSRVITQITPSLINSTTANVVN